MEASSRRHDRSLINSIFSPAPFWREWEVRLTVFSPSGDQVSPRSHLGAHPESVPENKRHSYRPGNDKGFRSSVAGTMAGTNRQNFYYLTVSLPASPYNQVLMWLTTIHMLLSRVLPEHRLGIYTTERMGFRNSLPNRSQWGKQQNIRHCAVRCPAFQFPCGYLFSSGVGQAMSNLF